MKRLLDQDTLRAMARGCAVLGAGGGGDTYYALLQALQAAEDFGPATLVDVDDLPGDSLIMPCGGIGAPLVALEKIEAGDEGERLRDLMQRHTGRTVTALMAGEIEMMIDNIPPQVPLIKAGKVRALAVTSLKRVSVLPDVPTMDEVGLKGYEVVSWFGLAARAGSPAEAVTRLNQALNRASQDPRVRETLESRGATIVQGSPEDFLDFVKAETAKFAPVVKRAGVVVD